MSDPIHLGILMVVNMEIGMITPPIGLNLFVTSGITGMSLVQVVKAAAPFVLVLLLFLIPGDICAGDLDLPALLLHGAGDHHPIIRLQGRKLLRRPPGRRFVWE